MGKESFTLSMELPKTQCYEFECFRITGTLLVALSLAYLKMTFDVIGAVAVILLFRLEYKTSVVCHGKYSKSKNCKERQAAHLSLKPV